MGLGTVQLFIVLLSVLLVSFDRVKNNLVVPKLWIFFPWVPPPVLSVGAKGLLWGWIHLLCSQEKSRMLPTPVLLKAMGCTAGPLAFAASWAQDGPSTPENKISWRVRDAMFGYLGNCVLLSRKSKHGEGAHRLSLEEAEGVGNSVLKWQVKMVSTKTIQSWFKNPAGGSLVKNPSSPESEARCCSGYIRLITVF